MYILLLIVLISFEKLEYTVNEDIGDQDLALQICLIANNSPLTFHVDVQLAEDSSEGTVYLILNDYIELVWLTVTYEVNPSV